MMFVTGVVKGIALYMAWTCLLYWMHRLAHVLPGLQWFHEDHHRVVFQHQYEGQAMQWSPMNFLLWNDTGKSTVDLWFTEVLPTLLFCWVFHCWWILAGYYVWAAIFQESNEHDPNVHWPGYMHGRPHLEHHEDPTVNYGFSTPLWDRLFHTYREPA